MGDHEDPGAVREGLARTGPLLLAVVVATFAVAAFVGLTRIAPGSGRAVSSLRLDAAPSARSLLAAPRPATPARHRRAPMPVRAVVPVGSPAPRPRPRVAAAPPVTAATASIAAPARRAPVARATPRPKPPPAPARTPPLRPKSSVEAPAQRPAPRHPARVVPDPPPAAPASPASPASPAATPDPAAPVAEVPATTTGADEAPVSATAVNIR
jgi:translation initiation factor IF-2